MLLHTTNIMSGKETWVKIYKVSPKLGDIVRMHIDRNIFDDFIYDFQGNLIVLPTNMLRFDGSLSERKKLELLVSAFSGKILEK